MHAEQQDFLINEKKIKWGEGKAGVKSKSYAPYIYYYF